MQKGLKNWFEIFRAGTHTSSRGVTKTYTEDFLDEIVEKTNFSVPCVIGHVKTNYPVYALVDELKREGDKLFAKCSNVKDEFEEFVKNSAKGLSISINSNKSLYHIAFLAVEDPAIEDLTPIEFCCAKDVDTYEFKNFNPEEKDLNKDKDTNDSTEKLAAKDKKIAELEAKLEKQEFEKTDEQIKAKDAKIAKLEAQLAVQEFEKEKSEFNSFCKKLEDDCKITPAQKESALEIFEAVKGPQEFSEDSANSALNALKTVLEANTKQFEYGEFAKKEDKDNFSANDNNYVKRGQEIAKALD